MKHLLTVLMTFTTLASTTLVSAKDVVPKSFKNGSVYVRVTKLSKTKVSFERCIKGYEDGSCEQIGKKDSYTVKELEKQRMMENAEIGGAILTDALVIIGGAFGGGLALGTLAGGSGTLMASFGASMGGAMIGGVAGLSGGIVASNMIDAINPAEQTRQAKTLNSNIIADDTYVSDSVEDYISRLELVLNKIN